MKGRILFGFLTACLFLHAGKIDQAFEALRIYDYFKAKKLFYASLKKEPTASSFGLAQIYFRKDNPFHQPDSAGKYIRAAILAYETEHLKKAEKFGKWKLTSATLNSLKAEICSLAFDNALRAGTLKALEYFISRYEDAAEYPAAVHARDSMEFNLAAQLDTWAAYKEFTERFPSSSFFTRAKSLFEERLFTTWTASGTLKSYELFLEKFPDSPHREEAENAIFGLSTISGTIDEYYLFIRKYPLNRNAEKAWYNIYTLYTKDFRPETFNDFLKVFPDYPYGENVNRDLELSKLILLPARQNGKWGFIDTTGKEVIPFIYEWCEEFSEGLAAVGIGGKAGFIDKSGIIIFPAEFDEVENFRDGFAEVSLGERSGVIRRTGKKIIPCEYEEISVEYAEGLISLKKNGKYGFFDLTGKLSVSFQFDKISRFRGGIAAAEVNGKWGYVDPQGKWLIDPVYEQASDFEKEGYAIVRNGNKFGVISRSGKIMIPLKYSFIGFYSEGSFMVADSLHYGFTDSLGTPIIPLNFEKPGIYPTFMGFHNGLAPGYKAGKAGLIDRKGKFVIPYDYETIETLSGAHDVFIARKKGRYGVIDKKGKTLLPFQYERFSKFTSGLVEVCKETDGSCGVINLQKKVIVPLIYDDIERHNLASVFIVELEEKLGLVDLEGRMLLEPQYESIDVGKEFIAVEKDKKLAWYDLKQQKFIWKEN